MLRPSHVTWALLTAFTALLVLLVTAPAAAQDDKPKKVAIHLEGTDADKYRSMIVDIVPEGVEVVEKSAFESSLRKSGLTGGKMGYAITSQTMRKTVIRIAAKSVERDGLAGAIIGRTRTGRTGSELVLLYVQADGELAVDEAVPLKGKEADQEAALAAALSPTLEALAPPKPDPVPEPEPEPEPVPKGDDDDDDDDDDESDFKANRPGSELFNISLGAEFGGRFFKYSESEANTANLRPYDVFGVPAIAVAGEIYPAAPFDIPFVSDLGLTVSYMHAFGLDSQTSDGRFGFGTNWNKFLAGLRYRFRVGDEDDHPFVFAADVKFGFQNFTFDPETAESETITNEIATTEYLFIRGGIDARLPIVDWFAVMPSFGFIGPLSGGAVYDRFTGSSVLGIDAGLLLTFVIGAGIELRGGAEYIRYFSSFDPVPGDAYVAGGALDQYVALKIGAAYVF